MFYNFPSHSSVINTFALTQIRLVNRKRLIYSKHRLDKTENMRPKQQPLKLYNVSDKVTVGDRVRVGLGREPGNRWRGIDTSGWG